RRPARASRSRAGPSRVHGRPDRHGSRAQGPPVGTEERRRWRDRPDDRPRRRQRGRERPRTGQGFRVSLTGRSVTVRVPATSANLGPGFDTLGLALSVYDEVTVTVRDQPGASVDVRGVGEGIVASDASNLVVRSLAHTFAVLGQPVPGVDLIANNVIPHGRGLGSSGAAVVAGIVAAQGLLDGIVDIDSDTLLRIATDLEGHPDNVAPAL